MTLRCIRRLLPLEFGTGGSGLAFDLLVGGSFGDDILKEFEIIMVRDRVG